MKTIKVKTSELTGAALDWAVMKLDPMCDGLEWLFDSDSGYFFGVCDNDDVEKMKCILLPHKLSLKDRITYRRKGLDFYSPSTNWNYAGKLIDVYQVGISCPGTEMPPAPLKDWVAGVGIHCRHCMTGSTALIAICRAIVASKIGDTVEVPEQLVGVKS